MRHIISYIESIKLHNYVGILRWMTFRGNFIPTSFQLWLTKIIKIIVCRMKDLAISRSLVLLSTLLFHVMCADTMGNGEELMSNDTVEIISLNTSQYCFVDDNTIRIDLITTTLY